MRSVVLTAVAVALASAATVSAQVPDDVRALISRAMQAHGGEARLARYPAEQVRGRGIIVREGKPISFTVETAVQLPGQIKNVMQYEAEGQKGTLVQVLDGDKGWLSVNGVTTPFDEALLTETRETMYVHRLSRLTALLTDKDLQVVSWPEVKVNGLPALGIKVSCKGRPDVYLYFDKASGLLVMTQRRAYSSSLKKEVQREEQFSDYKEINGIKRPMKIIVFQDGAKFMEGEMLEIKQSEKLPDGTFAKP
jgi:hypothetical protein